MPTYVFKHPDKEEYEEVVQSMNEEHKYESDGKEWERVYTPPQTQVKDTINPLRPQDFVEATRHKRGTLGDLMDQSKELGEERKKIYGGKDPVQEKFFDNYASKRKGTPHPDDPRIDTISKGGITATNVKDPFSDD